jgi:hypothetical protein
MKCATFDFCESSPKGAPACAANDRVQLRDIAKITSWRWRPVMRSRRFTIGAYGTDFADSYREPVERSLRRHDVGFGSGFGS